MTPCNRSDALLAAGFLAAATALAAAPALGQVQDRVDLQQIETVPAGADAAPDTADAPETAAEAAPEKPAEGSAGATVDEIVGETRRDPETGQVEAEAAGAGPTENWFGCKPSEEGQMVDCDEAAEGQAATR